MGVRASYVQADKTGRLFFRRIYPPELRPHIPDNRRELKRTPGAIKMNIILVWSRRWKYSFWNTGDV